MIINTIHNLFQKGVHKTDDFEYRCNFSNTKIILFNQENELQLFNVATGAIKTLPVSCDIASFSPENTYLVLSKGNTISVFSLKSGLKDLSPSGAEITFQIQNLLYWKFISGDIILALSTSGIEACSLKARQTKNYFSFSSVSNAPSFEGFKCRDFATSTDKKNFVASGTQNGIETVFVISVTLTKALKVLSPAGSIFSRSEDSSSTVLFGSGEKVNLINISPSNPSKDQISIFEQGEEVGFIDVDESGKRVLVFSKQGNVKEVDLGSKQVLSSSSTNSSPISMVRSSKELVTGILRNGDLIEVKMEGSQSSGDLGFGIGKDSSTSFGGEDFSKASGQFSDSQSAENLLMAGDVSGAIKAVIRDGPDKRTVDTLELFRNTSLPNEKVPPVVRYLVELVSNMKLKDFESIELAKLFIAAKKKDSKKYLEDWVAKDRLEITEELGDVLKDCDLGLAGLVYERAGCFAKRIGVMLQLGEVGAIVPYAKKVGFQPDYELLFNQLYKLINQTSSTSSSEEGKLGKVKSKEFAVSLLKEVPPLMSVEEIAELMLRNGDNESYIDLMLNVFKRKGDHSEDSYSQTKFLETVASNKPELLPTILNSTEISLSYFDREAVGMLLEEMGKPNLALLCYKEEESLTRALAAALLYEGKEDSEGQTVFGTKQLTAFLRNQMKKGKSVAPFINYIYEKDIQSERTDEIISDSISELLKEEELVPLLGIDSVRNTLVEKGAWKPLIRILRPVVDSIKSKEENPELVLIYIQALIETENFKEAEKVCKESEGYDPEAVKQYLVSVHLRDPRALIFLCDKHGFLSELTSYLINNSMVKFLFVYVQKVNPSSAAKVLESMISMGRPNSEVEELVSGLNMTKADAPKLVEVLLSYNMGSLLVSPLERSVRSGSSDMGINTALAKLYIGENMSLAEEFVRNNKFLDYKEVGDFAALRSPKVALVAYAKGNLDESFMEVTNGNSLFFEQAKYLVQRKDEVLWKSALDPNNEFRAEMIDQVVNKVLSTENDAENISVAVRAFIAADVPNMLMNLLETILLTNKNPSLQGNKNLQNLLILTAIKSDRMKVTEYVNRLKNFDTDAIGKMARQYGLFEEAIVVYEKANRLQEAFDILINNLHDIGRAKLLASKKTREGNEKANFLLGKIALNSTFVKEAFKIISECRAVGLLKEAVKIGKEKGEFESLLKYLYEVKPLTKDPIVVNNILLILAGSGRVTEMAEFLSQNPNCSVEKVAEESFREKRFESAAVLYKHLNRSDRLAECYIFLGDLEGALEGAKKANTRRIWKTLLEISLEKGKMEIAIECGSVLSSSIDQLDYVVKSFEKLGRTEELIQLLLKAISKEKAHQGIYTQLAIALCKFKPEKLRDFLVSNWHNLILSQVVRVLLEYFCFDTAVLLYLKYKQYDSAIRLMVAHAPLCFDLDSFKECLQRSISGEVIYSAVKFVFDYYPDLLNELLPLVSSKLDYRRVVALAKEKNLVFFIAGFLESLANMNNRSVAETLCDYYIEEEMYDSLSRFVRNNEQVDKRRLAMKLEKHERAHFKVLAARLFYQFGDVEKAIQVAKKNNSILVLAEISGVSRDSAKVRETVTDLVERGLSEFTVVTLVAASSWLPLSEMIENCLYAGDIGISLPLLVSGVRKTEKKIKQLEEKLQNLENGVESVKKKRDNSERRAEVSSITKLALEASSNINSGNKKSGEMNSSAYSYGNNSSNRNSGNEGKDLYGF